jgi:Mce-associated membrane protein
MTTPTWYDVLGVDRSATTDQIRAAWRSGVEGLDPTDRRFRSLSDAAAVLLDDQRRSEYDAGLPEPEETGSPEPAVAAEPAPEDGPGAVDPTPQSENAPSLGADDTALAGSGTATSTPRRRVPLVPTWLLAALGILAAVCVAAAAVSWSKSPGAEAGGAVTVANNNAATATGGQDAGKTITYNHTLTVESEGAAALAAAKVAIVPILSYDYRHMKQSETRAEAYMTDAYKPTYEKLFAVLQANAPHTHTVVKTEPPLDAGVVRVSPGVVQVLLFVDRPTTNASHKKPLGYQDQATLTMEKVGDRWLVGQITTSPAD